MVLLQETKTIQSWKERQLYVKYITLCFYNEKLDNAEEVLFQAHHQSFQSQKLAIFLDIMSRMQNQSTLIQIKETPQEIFELAEHWTKSTQLSQF